VPNAEHAVGLRCSKATSSGRFRNRKHSCGDRGVHFRVDELTDYIHTLADTCRDPRLFGSISKRLAWKVPDWLEATAIETTVNLARRSDAETKAKPKPTTQIGPSTGREASLKAQTWPGSKSQGLAITVLRTSTF